MEKVYSKKEGRLERFWSIESNDNINLIYTANRRDENAAVFKSRTQTFLTAKMAKAAAKQMVDEKVARGYRLFDPKKPKVAKPAKSKQTRKQPAEPNRIHQNVSISKSKLEFLRTLYDSSLSVAQLRKNLKPISDPIVLHYVAWLSAETLTWHDVGFEWPNTVLKHPACDGGTALMIYWLSDPIFRYTAGSDNWQKPLLSTLKRLEKNYLEGQYKSFKIRFDPKPLFPKKADLTQMNWIPYGMTIPSRGRVVKPIKIEMSKDQKYIF